MIKIVTMTEDCIWFVVDTVNIKKYIAVHLPAMSSFPEGYVIKVYGDLKRDVHGALYMTDLRTVDPTDMLIYRAFIEYLSQEKVNKEISKDLFASITNLVETTHSLTTKIKGLHDTVQGTKDKVLLSKMNTYSKTVH